MTRYTGGRSFRILDSMRNNWLLGHWNGNAGVNHQNRWLSGVKNRIPKQSHLLCVERPGRVWLRSSDPDSEWIYIENRGARVHNEIGLSINNGRFRRKILILSFHICRYMIEL